MFSVKNIVLIIAGAIQLIIQIVALCYVYKQLRGYKKKENKMEKGKKICKRNKNTTD